MAAAVAMMVACGDNKSKEKANDNGNETEITTNENDANEQEPASVDNKTLGEQFLQENAGKEGVVTTESGLQYKVLTEGNGAKPQLTDQVRVHYEGRLIDGTVFDSSYQRGEPAVFGLQQVISGWTEALQLMPVGSVWEIYLPQELAYGGRDLGSIPPYSTLIFKVELLGIE